MIERRRPSGPVVALFVSLCLLAATWTSQGISFGLGHRAPFALTFGLLMTGYFVSCALIAAIRYGKRRYGPRSSG